MDKMSYTEVILAGLAVAVGFALGAIFLPQLLIVLAIVAAGFGVYLLGGLYHRYQVWLHTPKAKRVPRGSAR